MTRNSELVFDGWLRLTENEKKEVLEEINKFQNLGYLEKRTIIERKIVTGPIGSICPCCGR